MAVTTERLTMFSQNDDDYKTCVHESLHVLRALGTGSRVHEINIATGQTLPSVARLVLGDVPHCT